MTDTHIHVTSITMASRALPGASQAAADVRPVVLMLRVCRGDRGAYSSAVRAQIHFRPTWVAVGDLPGLQSDSAVSVEMLPLEPKPKGRTTNVSLHVEGKKIIIIIINKNIYDILNEVA